MSVAPAIVMAVIAAMLFAVAAACQNFAVTAVVGEAERPAVGASQLRELARSRTWLSGVLLTAIASVLHAGALVLAPVVLVQPVGVLSVPLAVLLSARRTGRRPPVGVVAAVGACLLAVVGFVVLADAAMASAPAPRFVGAVTAAAGTALAAVVLALAAATRRGWQRCAGFAAAGATAYGLVSALMRLVSLHLSTGVNDLDDVGVLVPVAGIALALLGGGWAIQQAHAAGVSAVVVCCTTVVDPLVAVGLGITMLGEATATAGSAAIGLVTLATVALGAAGALARQYPADVPVTVD
jgi:hypothetical protein